MSQTGYPRTRTYKSWLMCVVCIAGLGFSHVSYGEETQSSKPAYLGVRPGAKDTAPGKTKLRKRRRYDLITWVGFQMIGQGGRVFVQSTAVPDYRLVPGASDEVVIEFQHARLQSVNDGRRLETAWFPTAVEWVDAEQRRRNVTRVTIKLRQAVGYDVRQHGNYLFLDFRPPTQLPAMPAPTAPPAPTRP